MSTTVEEVREVDVDLVAAFKRLIPQLSSSPPPTADKLATVLASDACHVLIARDDDSGEIVGTTTLVVFPIPTGVRAWIEDVVVDEAARGGTGKALTRYALDLARSLGAKTVDLTSRPSRVVANGMYQKLGFEQRETNVYRFELEATDPGR